MFFNVNLRLDIYAYLYCSELYSVDTSLDYRKGKCNEN